MTAIHHPFAADRIPDEVRANTRRHRSFAELIRELGEQHEAHVRGIEAFGERVDAFGADIEEAGRG